MLCMYEHIHEHVHVYVLAPEIHCYSYSVTVTNTLLQYMIYMNVECVYKVEHANIVLLCNYTFITSVSILP